MSKSRFLSLRRWGPAALVLTVALAGAIMFHRELIVWFGGNPNSLFGESQSRERTVVGPFHSAGPFKVAVDIDPDKPVVGENRISVVVQMQDGSPVSNAEVRAVAEMPAMGAMPAMQAAAQMKASGAGIYTGDMELSMTGGWPLTVTVESKSMGKAQLHFDMSTIIEGLRLTTATPASQSGKPVAKVDETQEKPLPEKGIAHHTCSMHTSVKSNTPGTCPICSMDLTPVTQEEVRTGTIFVDAQRRQLIGVKTDEVRRQELVQSIRTVGLVTYDETRLVDISLKFRGWIGEISADYTGKFVKAGEPLFTIYSPELLSAQQEYLDARNLRKNSERGGRLLQASKRHLLLWDIKEEQIEALAKRGEPLEYVPILSPTTGTILQKTIVKGSATQPGALLYRIADLSTLWVEAELYEYELPLVEVGQKVKLSLTYLPAQSFEGEVTFIYPYLNAKTRTGRVRIEVPNPEGRLKPDMYADVAIDVPLGERLVVPEQAVLYAGDTRVVFLDRGEGRLESRRIKVGVKNKDFLEVIDGLKEGDVVVTSGNFLIASESKLKSGLEKW